MHRKFEIINLFNYSLKNRTRGPWILAAVSHHVHSGRLVTDQMRVRDLAARCAVGRSEDD